MVIILSGKIKIKPEMREQAIAAALKMAAASAAEEGCYAYRFYADLEDPNTLFLFERWDNAEALKQHGQTAHMAEFRQIWPQYVAERNPLDRFEASPLQA